MNVTKVITAHVVGFLSHKQGPTLYVPDVIAALQEKYGFVSVPRTPEEVLAADQSFKHGKFPVKGSSIVVDLLRVLPQAIMVDMSTSTDDAEAFLDDFREWVKGTFHQEFIEGSTARVYGSQLEVFFDFPLEHFFPALNPIGQTVASLLRGYGREEVYPLGVFAFAMNTDPTKVNIGFDFRIERRLNVPFESNTYFAQAPLKTADHVAILQELEQTMQKASHGGIPKEATLADLLRNKP